jgi:hypothetical protein
MKYIPIKKKIPIVVKKKHNNEILKQDYTGLFKIF